MKKLTGLLATLFFLGIGSTFAQDSDSRREMNRFLSKNLMYPTELRQSGAQGIVVVSVEVDQRGFMTEEYEILSGEVAFNEEIERVMKLLKDNWNPAYVEDKSDDNEYLMSFEFKLSTADGFPPNPFLTSSQKKTGISPLEAVNQALKENPFSPKLYKDRAEILDIEGQELLSEMDLNQAKFLKNKMLTEVVIVGYHSDGPKSL